MRRALERVGEEVAGILQRAHETAAEITAQSRSDAEDRLEAARHEAAEISVGPSGASRSSTSTPIGSGPSATGSSRTPEIWPASSSRLPKRRPTRFPAAEEPAPSAPAGTAPAAGTPPAPFDADADLGPQRLDREPTAEDALEAPAEVGSRAQQAPAPTEHGPEPVDLPFPFAGEALVEPEPEIDPEQTAVLPRFERRDSEVETQVQRKTEPPSGPSAS